MKLLLLVSRARERLRSDAGQATVEYVLMLCCAGAVGIIALGLVRHGRFVEKMFEAAISQIMNGVIG